MKKPQFDTTALKHQVEEQPLIAAGLIVALLNGVVKVMNAQSENRNSRTYKKEVDRRIRVSK